MKRIILGISLATSLFASQVIELVCDKGYPPYTFKGKDKKAHGVYIDVIQSAFDKIPEYDVKFKIVAWKKALSNVKKGKALGIIDLYYSK